MSDSYGSELRIYESLPSIAEPLEVIVVLYLLIIKRIAIFLCCVFRREDGSDCGGVSTPGHGQGEGPARYEFRDSGTK